MSIRLRLTLAYVGLFAVALTVLDVGLYYVVQRALLTSIDNELVLGARVVQESFSKANIEPQIREGGGLILTMPDAVNNFATSNLLAIAYDTSGRLSSRSVNLLRQPSLARLLLLDADTIRTAINGDVQRFT
ncbi:MAG: sensor histidine kinase, partial [Roseiflexaceae bacterium]